MKTVVIILLLSLVVPIAVWAGSGRAHAWFAYKRFLFCLALVMGLPFAFSQLLGLIR